MDIDNLLQLESLDSDGLDRVSYGVVRLGQDGTIEAINRAEAERLGVQRWRATGREYFRDVAGASARPLAETAAALAPGARATVTLELSGARGSRRGAPVEVELCRTHGGKLVLCIRARELGARGAA